MLGKVKKNQRNLEYIEFEDEHNIKCAIQQSGLETKSPAIWVGRDNNMMHLELEQVKELIETLNKWVENGNFEDKK